MAGGTKKLTEFMQQTTVIVSSQILKEMKQGAIGHFSEGTGLP
jgi:hypothetical protein